MLIDSEPLWRRAEVVAFNAVGVPMVEDDGFLTIGLRTDEVVEFWFARHPWEGVSKKEVEANLVKRGYRIDLHRRRSNARSYRNLGRRTCGGYKIGLASSSSSEIIAAVLNRLGIAEILTLPSRPSMSPMANRIQPSISNALPVSEWKQIGAWRSRILRPVCWRPKPPECNASRYRRRKWNPTAGIALPMSNWTRFLVITFPDC